MTLVFWAALFCTLPGAQVHSTTKIPHTVVDWHQSPQATFPLAPFSLERGEDIPKNLLDSLAKKAGSYELLLDKFTCVEETRRGNKKVVSHDYLLSRLDDPGEFREIRFVGTREVKGLKSSKPPPPTWSLLFSESYQPHFVYRYVDETLEDFDRVHRILFRGNRSFEVGTDIREWEGLAGVDAVTHDVVSIRAMPRLYAEHTSLKHKKQLRSLRFVFGSFSEGRFTPVKTVQRRRGPVAPYLQVNLEKIDIRRYDPQDSGSALTLKTVRLPSAVRMEQYRQAKDGKVSVIGYEVTQYLNYRFFSTDAEALGYGR
jgi:hypothetical protein